MTGFLISFRSQDRISAVIKNLGLIVLVSVIMRIYEGGIGRLDRISVSLWPSVEWFYPDIQFKGLFITTLPKMEVFIPSVFFTRLWFTLSIAVLAIVIQRYEVQ